MVSAIATPSGTSITRIVKVKNSCRPSAAWKRGEPSTSSNQRMPAQKKVLAPKVSCTE